MERCTAKKGVGPRVGPRVEMQRIQYQLRMDRSAPVWGRELKCPVCSTNTTPHVSAPVWGRELKYRSKTYKNHLHPVGPRVGPRVEIMPLHVCTLCVRQSAPVWGRELKWTGIGTWGVLGLVGPRVGPRVEILLFLF